MQYNNLRIIILLGKPVCMKYGYRLELEDNSYKERKKKPSNSQSCELELTSCRSLNKSEERIDWERLDA